MYDVYIIGMYCSNLERLDLSEMYLTQSAVKKLSQKCPELKVHMTQQLCNEVERQGKQGNYTQDS